MVAEQKTSSTMSRGPLDELNEYDLKGIQFKGTYGSHEDSGPAKLYSQSPDRRVVLQKTEGKGSWHHGSPQQKGDYQFVIKQQ
jgi:hypothetical protein